MFTNRKHPKPTPIPKLESEKSPEQMDDQADENEFSIRQHRQESQPRLVKNCWISPLQCLLYKRVQNPAVDGLQ